MRSALRDTVDRWRYPRLRRTGVAGFAPRAGIPRAGFETTCVDVGTWAQKSGSHTEAANAEAEDIQRWYPELLLGAEAIAAGRLRFLNLDSCDLGQPMGWNRDHECGRSAPLVFSAAVDYRDFARVGDAKLVWEPNRHHQLVVLGRAFRASGNLRYAVAALEQLESWLTECPFGLGMNWRSPLELAVRVVNWVWALDLIRPSGLLDGPRWTRLLHAVYLHLWEVTRKYSQGSSANNHRIGEAAGVFIAASYFPDLPGAPGWVAHAREILESEIVAQTYGDGGSREQALGYQVFVMQFFLLAGLAARRTGNDFSATYWKRLEKTFTFAAALLEGGDAPPMFGDGDDGYVLNLGGRAGDLRAWLPVAAVLFARADLKAVAGVYSECAQWLLGADGRACFGRLTLPTAERRVVSRSLPESGYYLLQYGRAGERDRISVLFDCGALGLGPLAAHGHADALSFTLRVFGVDVLVDPGTYDYFAYPEWRHYFRSTRAHNTVEIDGTDQSVMAGPFMWGSRAQATCVSWDPDECGGCVVGEHDGYARLPDPVVHRRTLELDGARRELTLEDEIRAAGHHELAIYFHFAEHCAVRLTAPRQVAIDVGAGNATLVLDPHLNLEILCGCVEPKGGWVSRGYHRKVPATTIVGRCASDGPVTLTCRVEMGTSNVD